MYARHRGAANEEPSCQTIHPTPTIHTRGVSGQWRRTWANGDALATDAHQRSNQDTLAEWLRRRPAKPKGLPAWARIPQVSFASASSLHGFPISWFVPLSQADISAQVRRISDDPVAQWLRRWSCPMCECSFGCARWNKPDVPGSIPGRVDMRAPWRGFSGQRGMATRGTWPHAENHT